jgi:outer membrane protein OmpA-like peptidoglycan-associated protein
MSFDLLESAKSIFNSNVVSQASSQLGESEGGIQKALGGIIPTVLTGLLNKAGSGDAGGLLNLVKGVAGDANPSAVTGALQSGGGSLLSKGGDLLRSLFGDKVSSITSMLSSYAGIKESSASTLLQSAAPATLGTLGQHAAQNNLSPSSFLSLLDSQKDKILGALPGGLNLAGILGLASIGDLGKKLGGLATGIGSGAAAAAGSTLHSVKSSSNRWVWSLLLILVAIILLWYLMRGCGGNKNNSVPVTDSVTTSQLTDSAGMKVNEGGPEVARESIKVTLPDGAVLDAYKGGIEDQLVTFLKDPNSKAGKDVWFDFDNLNFKTGSAELTEESMKQVGNIAAILKAFPKTKIKIGGYTDRTGDSTANLHLSKLRAESVVTVLEKENTNHAQLLGAEGYGSQFAKAAADAPDADRKKDRHISVSVREK